MHVGKRKESTRRYEGSKMVFAYTERVNMSRVGILSAWGIVLVARPRNKN